MLSYPEHITTCISTQQRECSPTHPKGIQKSLQNTSPRDVNAAVKSVSRLLVSSKVQNSSAIYLSIRADVDLEGVYCDLTMDQSEASMITNIQANFGINRPIRCQITARRNYLHRRQTDNK